MEARMYKEKSLADTRPGRMGSEMKRSVAAHGSSRLEGGGEGSAGRAGKDGDGACAEEDG